MEVDKGLFYSNSLEYLRKAQKAHDNAIDEFLVTGEDYIEKLKIYRKRRSELLKQAAKSGISATTAGDVVRGECAQEKADYMSAQLKQQVAKLKIRSTENRMNNIRAINKGIEHTIKTGE